MQVELARTPLSHVAFLEDTLLWDGRTEVKVDVPTDLYERTCWISIVATGSYGWQGNLLAQLSGRVVFQMPLKYGVVGDSSGLTVSYDSTNTNQRVPDVFQYNTTVGHQMFPFTFVACCDEIILRLVAFNPLSTVGNSRFLMVRSKSKW